MSDYTLGDTIYHAFTTRAFATGVPTVLAGTPTLEIYENDSITPIVEGVGKLVLTVSLNSIAGFNLATITATSGNGFETGKTYHLIVKTGTVGGTSVVGEVVGRFTLGASAAAVDLANGTDGLGAIKTDSAAILVDTAVIGAAGAGLTAVPWNAAWDEEVQSEVDDALVAQNLDHIAGTAAAIPAIVAGTYLDQMMDDGTAVYDRTTDSLQAIRDTAPLGTAMRGTDSAALASVCTEARLAELDAANLPTDVAAVKTDTAAILVDTGTTLEARIPAALSAGGNMKCDVEEINAVTIIGDGSGTPFNV